MIKNIIRKILIISLLINTAACSFKPKIKLGENIKETAMQIIENNKEAIKFTVSMFSPVKSTNQLIKAVTARQKLRAKEAIPVKKQKGKECQEEKEENTIINVNEKTNKGSKPADKKNKVSKWEIFNFFGKNKQEKEALGNIERKIAAEINKDKACSFFLARSSLESEGIIFKEIKILK